MATNKNLFRQSGTYMVSECINFAVYKCLHRSSFGDVSSPVPFFWNEGGMVGCLQRGKLPNNSQEHETFAVSNRQVPKLWWFVFFFWARHWPCTAKRYFFPSRKLGSWKSSMKYEESYIWDTLLLLSASQPWDCPGRVSAGKQWGHSDSTSLAELNRNYNSPHLLTTTVDGWGR